VQTIWHRPRCLQFSELGSESQSRLVHRQLDADPRLSIFVDRGKYASNDSVLVDRISLDQPVTKPTKEEVPGRASTALTIKSVLARELCRP
jgi:hypothetical protein